MEELIDIMRRLRDPDGGCPWDIEQDFASIAPYTIEEAYEVADAVQREAWDELRDELGDLLLQVVFHAQMADEAGLFNFADVAQSIGDKLVRRHPHIFADAVVETADDQSEVWEAVKADERAAKGLTSIVDDVPRSLPELLRAKKLQKRAARAGFDWPDAAPVLDKIDEETDELREALNGGNPERIEDEMGDLLFAAVNLARKARVDPGRALRQANAKFEARFRAMETAAGGSDAFAALDLDQQEALWEQVKRGE
ncbi:nucleoside triphosphate pyrophosphohydrolase [Marinihelvus fidelis]|uniref:Nucleoside triphosphate pyrophosphohydrolase n=1 Tax=Marinihelvus fidelis TaxID=2613842 RepID=A0A5N0TGH4_9GAMM|nr:nucleoside triphosphate pyrophosphohydrolase [Marinihelvus fidelis]KAA9133568.1 nucleoside triphosphate pyrophosphohydrolase [Marinihelvus fidelis]